MTHLVTDGAHVYVLMDALYRFAINEVNASTDASHLVANYIPAQGSFRSIATDGVDLFVQDFKDVYRVHK